MSAAAALKAARTAGIRLGVEGDALTLEAATAPPAAVLDLLSHHKAAVIALLRPAPDGWSVENWLALFDERAAISEFDGGLPRTEAEALALECCLIEWLNRNPVRSPSGSCLACGTANNAHDPLVPFGTEPTGHAWLHSRCWSGWHKSRRETALTALSSMGITINEDER